MQYFQFGAGGTENGASEESSAASNEELDTALSEDSATGVEDEVLKQSSTPSNEELDMALNDGRITGGKNEALEQPSTPSNGNSSPELSEYGMIGVGETKYALDSYYIISMETL